jgi:FtsH-binding integral membrane protein
MGMSKLDQALSVAGVGSWIAFIVSLSMTNMDVVRGPLEPLANPTQLGNIMFLLAFGLGSMSLVLFGVRLSKVELGKLPLWLGFAGAVLFCSILLLAALRFSEYGA